jgi:LmbE family N-acetylglucosaminyl deacetylase
MASFLYVFPHPDDESFGPAPLLAKQRRAGHDVHLLTLTKGEATKQRHKYGYSKAEMGAVRYEEMQAVADTLGLSSLTVLDFPDGGLDDLDPHDLEDAITERIEATAPTVLITYAVHGISGHPDHLVSHAVVKRAFCALRGTETAPRRLAFYTLSDDDDGAEDRPAHLRSSAPEAIDCRAPLSADDLEAGRAALDCYKTYQDVVEEHQPLDHVGDGLCFAFFQESFTPPLDRLTAGLD